MSGGKKYQKRRPDIPVATVREIRIEAFYACLICGNTDPVEIAHLDGNRENNDPSNLALLCVNHHRLYDKKRIPLKDIQDVKDQRRRENQALIEAKKKLDYAIGAPMATLSEGYVALKLRYQNQMGGFTDQLLFYQAFIYLVPEFFIDARGQALRNVVRGMIGISPEEEQLIIEHLKRMGLVEIVGDALLVLKDRNDAKTALNEMLAGGKVKLEDVMAKLTSV